MANNNYGSLPTMNQEMQHILTDFMPSISSPEKQSTQQQNINDVDFDNLLKLLATPEIIPKINIVPCQKTRGETYLIEGKQLTTKRSQWVPVQISGLLTGQTVRTSLRYEDVDFKERTPVLCNNNCICTSPNLTGYVMGQSAFCVRSSDALFFPETAETQLHPFVEANPSKEDIIHVLFRCWNSCDSHKKCGKNRLLLVEMVDVDGSVVHAETFSLRVCESIKRDHQGAVMGPSFTTNKKRKISTSGPALKIESSDSSNSTIVLEINERDSQILHGENSEPRPILFPVKKEFVPMKSDDSDMRLFTPRTIMAKMKNEADEVLLQQFIERLDGDFKCM